MHFFISDVFATVKPSSQSNPYSLFILLISFISIFYFMIFRPQQKRNKAHKKLINSISQGDEVLTTGGILGVIVKVLHSGYIIISLNQSHEIVVKKDFVITVLPKGTIKSLLN